MTALAQAEGADDLGLVTLLFFVNVGEAILLTECEDQLHENIVTRSALELAIQVSEAVCRRG